MRAAHTASSRAYRGHTRDREVAGCGPEKARRIDLGLSILAARVQPGAELSPHDIAAWCGCTCDAISLVQKRALMKLGNKLKFGSKTKFGRELVA